MPVPPDPVLPNPAPPAPDLAGIVPPGMSVAEFIARAMLMDALVRTGPSHPFDAVWEGTCRTWIAHAESALATLGRLDLLRPAGDSAGPALDEENP